VRNLVSHTEEIKQTEDIREQDARENIQMDRGGSNRKSGETCMLKSFKKFKPRHTPQRCPSKGGGDEQNMH
jgi:hypothetical protein